MPKSPDDTRPTRRFAHAAIRDALRRDIEDGRLRAGDQLPTEFELVERFAVSRHTVRVALQQLASEGLIVRRAGQGTFVTTYATDPANVHIVGDDQHIFGLAAWPPADVVESLHVTDDPVAARALDVLGEPVLRLAFRRTAERRRVGYWQVSMPLAMRAQVEPALAGFQGSSGTIIATIEAVTGRLATRAEQTMTAEASTEDIATLLEVERNAALLRVERTYYDEEGRPLQHVLARFVPALFAYRLNVLRSRSANDRERRRTRIPEPVAPSGGPPGAG
jgi:GntR family transcriptional regulator